MRVSARANTHDTLIIHATRTLQLAGEENGQVSPWLAGALLPEGALRSTVPGVGSWAGPTTAPLAGRMAGLVVVGAEPGAGDGLAACFRRALGPGNRKFPQHT